MAITVCGVVQGVGFRPFVYNAARARGLSGWVQNQSDLVAIEVQGAAEDVEALCQALRHGHPPQARIDAIEVRDLAPQPEVAGFQIRASADFRRPRPAIPADLAICGQCLAEIRTPGERRYGYPFTNCTNCGPRWSIIERLPYDRPRTSMKRFAMCAACAAEYHDPADRRFHAQPIACPECGPRLELLAVDGQVLAPPAEALAAAARAVQAGLTLAIRGLGGFQLIVDATSAAAVDRLRQRKRRPHKPLAVMLGTLVEVGRHCEVSEREAEVLLSPQAPILLLRRRPAAGEIAEAVAPGNPCLGVMLPYTPLHHLLYSAVGRPIVCTSGNLSEEPMATATEDALARLGSIADALLTHNRPIVRPVDDSVVQLDSDGLQILRRARGYAPLPLRLGNPAALDGAGVSPALPSSVGPTGGQAASATGRLGNPDPSGGAGVSPALPSGSGKIPASGGQSLPTILAVGGHLKNTVALALGNQVVISPHVGDLDSLLSVDVHRRAIADLVDFFAVTPAVVACDLHPDYASTRHAEQLAVAWGAELVRVQHHHAHVAACAAEHGLEGPVLGLSWDGTGYGPDGTVWGGEMLVCQGPHFQRLAHLRTFPLPGGDRAVREPRRSALGLLYEVHGDAAPRYLADRFTAAELPNLLAALARRLNCPRTSSMGRLFDAVAALCGLSDVISFEGQAAMALEFAADGEEIEAYPLPLVGQDPAVADWGPMLAALLADSDSGVPPARRSARFHNGLAELAVAVARRWGGSRVALTGGCFQNALLTERTRRRLRHAGFTVYTHHQVPPGDGGIALGQIAVAGSKC
jgi:hydrogenase maturation protein HypF